MTHVSANQFQLVPEIASRLTGGIQSGQGIAGQFQIGRQREQQIEQGAEAQASKRLVNSALSISALPDDKKLEALIQNREQIISRGGNPAETEAGIQLAQAGNFEELNSSLKNIVDIGVRQGIIKPLSAISGLTSEQREFAGLTKDLTAEQVKDARLIELGLKARAGSSKEERLGESQEATEAVAKSQAIIEKKKSAAKETGKLSAQLNLKPEVDAAVVTAVAQAKFDADIKIENRSNQKAFDVYNAAKSNLVSALGGTITGPGAGWIPALTASAQIANGAVAMMAPVLKQLFRASGEGTFTDKDQEMLIAMVPTRETLPEARVVQLAAIDSIVSAKLGTISEEAKEKTGQKAVEQPAQGGVKFLGFE